MGTELNSPKKDWLYPARLIKRWWRRHFASRLNLNDLIHWPKAEAPWNWQKGKHLATWLERINLFPPFPTPDANGYAKVVALYENLEEARVHFPLGLTPYGCRSFTAWLLIHPHHPITLAETLGFLEEAPAKASQLWAITFLNQPEWQEKYPTAHRSEKEWSNLVGWAKNKYHLRAHTFLHAPMFYELSETPNPQVQVSGHFQYPSGLQVAADSLVEGLQAAGLRVGRRGVPAAPGDKPRNFSTRTVLESPKTIVVMSPEPYFATWATRAGVYLTANHEVIAVWYWEMEEVPKHWKEIARGVKEIWAPTKFIQNALMQIVGVPVYSMLPAVTLPNFSPQTRSELGLPNDFLFLFIFDLASVMERKNPLGLIAAFRQAFNNQPGVSLVLKVSRGEEYPEQLEQLRQAALNNRVILLDGNYPREKVAALINCCDAYVSLHRSEGFGLTIAEAMLLGKPVIATAYSGNLDFMESDYSLLVNYQRVELDRDYGPYKKGWHWAEPDLQDAVEKMRLLFNDRELARRLGTLARQRAIELFSPAAAGARMNARLNPPAG